MELRKVLKELKSHGNPAAVEGMARYGISSKGTLGVSVPVLRNLAKEIGIDHSLALRLWDSGVHEGRILAALVDDPAAVTEDQMEAWVSTFDSWDVCDGCCGTLFDKTALAYDKAMEWTAREEEYVKRAGFVLMAELAVHDKKAPDRAFEEFLPVIRRGARDERNFVKKGVNWALRQIGKRNPKLHRKALALARELSRSEVKGARWVGIDAVRELESRGVAERLRRSS